MESILLDEFEALKALLLEEEFEDSDEIAEHLQNIKDILDVLT